MAKYLITKPTKYDSDYTFTGNYVNKYLKILTIFVLLKSEKFPKHN